MARRPAKKATKNAARKSSKRATRKRRTPEPASPPGGWWGDGDAPWVRWPGVSIELPAEWIIERERWESPCGRYYFDEAAAQRPLLSAGYFQPRRGALANEPMRYLDWQERLVVRPLFGWLRARDGLRRFRYVFVEVAKKNGKSLFCSALGCHLAFCDGEPGAKVYVAAGDEKQGSDRVGRRAGDGQ